VGLEDIWNQIASIWASFVNHDSPIAILADILVVALAAAPVIRWRWNQFKRPILNIRTQSQPWAWTIQNTKGKSATKNLRLVAKSVEVRDDVGVNPGTLWFQGVTLENDDWIRVVFRIKGANPGVCRLELEVSSTVERNYSWDEPRTIPSFNPEAAYEFELTFRGDNLRASDQQVRRYRVSPHGTDLEMLRDESSTGYWNGLMRAFRKPKA